MTAYYSFAENLRYYREKRDMTQTDLAKKLSVTKQTVSSWETAIRYPQLDTIYDIARVLGIDVVLLVTPREE